MSNVIKFPTRDFKYEDVQLATLSLADIISLTKEQHNALECALVIRTEDNQFKVVTDLDKDQMTYLLEDCLDSTEI